VRTVLHHINTAGPGGAETVYRGLVSGLSPEHWRAVTVVPNEGWITEALRADGHEPVVLRSRSRMDGAYIRTLLRLVDKHAVDLIQSHYFGPAVTASLLGMLRRIPVVATLHGTGDLSGRESLAALKKALIRRGATRVVFVSEPLRASFEARLALDPARVRVIENGIDPVYFRARSTTEARARLERDPDVFLIGAVGNVRPSKGYEILLQSFALLRESVPGARLVIAGQAEGADYQDLQRVRAELGLTGQVDFLGYRDDLPDLLPALDALVISSHSEGFSLVAVEAMAVGLPVLSTRCGGPETIIEHEVTGLLVPPRDPVELARGLHRLWQHRELRARLGTAARASARARFTLERQVDRYDGLYRECLREPARETRNAPEPAPPAPASRALP